MNIASLVAKPRLHPAAHGSRQTFLKNLGGNGSKHFPSCWARRGGGRASVGKINWFSAMWSLTCHKQLFNGPFNRTFNGHSCQLNCRSMAINGHLMVIELPSKTNMKQTLPFNPFSIQRPSWSAFSHPLGSLPSHHVGRVLMLEMTMWK